MLKHSSKTVALAAGMAALTGVVMPALADCDSRGNVVVGTTSVCYHFKGSDTLFDIVTKSISNAKTASVGGAESIFYDGTGSGNAESQMSASTGNGVSPAHLGAQSIGPMSRNFRPKFIDPAATTTKAVTGTFAARAAGVESNPGHAAWAPSCQNVIGLDAAVFISQAASGLNDIEFNVTTNGFASPATFKQGAQNAALTSVFTDGSAFNNLSSTVNYSSLWSIVLSGVDGTGSLQACSDPRRVRALLDLSTALGVPFVDHFYRRDDNSGTTDTIKDRIMVVPSQIGAAPQTTVDPRYPVTGGRFCNGQSIGGINGANLQAGYCAGNTALTCRAAKSCSNAPTSACSLDSDCGTGNTCVDTTCFGQGGAAAGSCNFNLNNQDFDPIRRACTPADGTHAVTSCTDLIAGKPCKATDGNPNCTQGLVVALTDADPGSTDVTTSIGNRIKNGGGSVIGFAGREAANGATFATKAIRVNNVKANVDDNVRNSSYLLARRLFLQNGAANSALISASNPTGATSGFDLPDDLAKNILQGTGANQQTAEQNLFNYMVSRTNTDPVVDQFNFIHCSYNGSGVDPCGESNNLCALPASPTAPPYSAAFPNGAAGANGAGGTLTITSDGTQKWNGTAFAPNNPAAAAAGGVNACITDGSTATGATCPAANNRPANSACQNTTDCAAGLTCKDQLGIGTAGTPISFVCAL